MKKLIIGWVVGATGLLISGVVFAQATVTLPSGNTLTQQKTRAIGACAVIGRNVDKRITNFENNKSRHIEQYQKTQKRITALVTKMETEGYDVSQIKVDLVTYNDKIVKFANDYAAYIADLRETKDFTCGRSEGEFKAKLAIARAQLKVVHDDSVAIKTFWSQTIKPELDALGGTN